MSLTASPTRFASICSMLLALVFGLGGCAGITKPSAELSGVKLQNLSLSDVTLLFDVNVKNPYPAAMPLLDLKYGLASGQTKLFDGTAKDLGSVPAGGSRVVSLPVKVTFAQLMQAMSGVKLGSVVPYTANLGLSATAPAVGRIDFPEMMHTGEVPIPAPPEVTLAGAPSWDKLGLSEIEGTLPLRIKNTNQFRVDLRRLDADLSIAGTQLGKVGASNSGSLEPGKSLDVPIKVALKPQSMGLSLLSALRDPKSISLNGVMDLNTPYAPLKASFSK